MRPSPTPIRDRRPSIVVMTGGCARIVDSVNCFLGWRTLPGRDRMPPTNEPRRPRPFPRPPPHRLTPNQVRGFWAAWGGWALDGMDSFIYALVLFPALRELLPRSGRPATAENVGFYGGLLFALFLFGWGLSLLWGPIADRF